MDGHADISWLHTGFHLMLDKWQITLFVTGALIGWVIWWLRSVFATKVIMEDCRKDMKDASLVYEDRNSEEHREIRKDMSRNHAEVLRTILNLKNGGSER